MVYLGQCSCGAIHYEWQTSHSIQGLTPRACQCDYCAAQNATYTSEYGSRLQITLAHPDTAHIVQHGFKTCDFVECSSCKVLVYVTSIIDGVRYAVINAATLRDRDQMAPPAPIIFSAETLDQRNARRQKNWINQVSIQTA